MMIIARVATLVGVVKIVKTLVGAMKIVNMLMGTMEHVVALEQAMLLMIVILIKLIMGCHGHQELKIIMSHKI